jgi:leader peptidase (prepilin peptidase) / N-methyltransferase
MFFVVIVILAGVAGAFAGSLIHAAAVRLPAELNAIGAPICAKCGTPEPTLAVIPGWSGACANCGARDQRLRWATQAAASILVMAALVAHGLTLIGLAVALFNLVLLVILRIDWQHHLIFVATIVPGIMLALAFAVLRSPTALISATIAGVGAGLVFAIFFVLAMLIYKQQALGFGDILLAVLIGTMTGIRSIVPALFVGMLLAAAGGLLLIAIGVRTRRDYIPYGAYLCAGTILVLIAHR